MENYTLRSFLCHSASSQRMELWCRTRELSFTVRGLVHMMIDTFLSQVTDWVERSIRLCDEEKKPVTDADMLHCIVVCCSVTPLHSQWTKLLSLWSDKSRSCHPLME